MASGGLNLQGQMRNMQRGVAPDSPGLKRVIGVLKDEVEPEMDTTRRQCRPPEILGFLDPSETPGDLGKLGSYRVQEVLGHGGMGIVLKAFDPTLHRAVAIKVLAPQLAASSSARQRFTREARAAAAIRNEHVVAIHAVDEWKGLPYLVMEYIPGARSRSGSTAPGRWTEVDPADRHAGRHGSGRGTRPGAGPSRHQAVQHPARERRRAGQDHRLRPGAGGGRRQPDAERRRGRHATVHGPRAGPRRTIDHRADLFSLGSVLYAMCTGRSPFRASTTLGVLKRVCDDTHRPIQEVNPDVPNWLSQIIDRLLAKDREDPLPDGRRGGRCAGQASCSPSTWDR